jgi:hypothetical protein
MAYRSSKQVGKKTNVGRPVTKRASTNGSRVAVKAPAEVVRLAAKMAIDLNREALKELERY